MADDNFVTSAPIELVQFATTPAAPPAGTIEIYGKTDGKAYRQTPAGVETELGGGSSVLQRTFAFFAS